MGKRGPQPKDPNQKPQPVRGRDIELEKMRKERIDAHPPICARCGTTISAPRRYKRSVKYCGDRCSAEVSLERRKLKSLEKRLERAEGGDLALAEDQLYGPDLTRKGPSYDLVVDTIPADIVSRWVDRKISTQEIIRRLGDKAPTGMTLSRVRNQLWNERMLNLNSSGWVPSAEDAALLGPDDVTMRNVSDDDPALFDRMLDGLADAFVKWRTRFFQVGKAIPYTTEPFHREWIKETLRAIYLGERLLILSPPRHGKTDLLIHFCVWLICRNPNIRILWVAPNTDIGENCLLQVRNLLEHEEELKKAYLPPGLTWAPQRRNATVWASDKFTVVNRDYAQKQPTMWSTGVGGRILSLDADFIVVDDPADPDTSYTEGGRKKVDNWFKVKLASRKMDRTGLVMISSRVHPDDLYSQYTDHPRWKTIVNKAHDGTVCGLDLLAPHPDAKTPCVLFPSLNPLSFLVEQYDVVGPTLFEMMYLNQPRPDTALIFNPELIRERCLDHSRPLGVNHIGGPFKLVAGLDPAATGTQAAFCWAVQMVTDPDNRTRQVVLYHMVDLQTQHAGGIEGALSVMYEWHQSYGLTTWVVEDNAYQSVFFRDPRVKQLSHDLGLSIKATSTDHQKKWDMRFGLSSLALIFHEGRVILPYADPEARRKTDAYIASLLKFTSDEGPTRKGSDIGMASWFPHATVIRRWVTDANPNRVMVLDENFSYPGYSEVSYDAIPWGGTEYPY